MHSFTPDRGRVEQFAECAGTMRIAVVLFLLIAAAGCSSLLSKEPSSRVRVAATAETDAIQQRLIAIGGSQFLLCNSCHNVDAAAPQAFGADQGPHLEGIVGRRAGAVEDFTYTEELRALDLVWDVTALDQWLQQPQALVPAMCEPFTGIASAEQRRALIAFLKNPPD